MSEDSSQQEHHQWDDEIQDHGPALAAGRDLGPSQTGVFAPRPRGNVTGLVFSRGQD
ncbi:MAG: hypothetical protein KAY29_05680 [Brevundimonas sp.]|nr:hypothetical protein [Brevundimonas sp.]